jgi:hypothetical protein
VSVAVHDYGVEKVNVGGAEDNQLLLATSCTDAF